MLLGIEYHRAHNLLPPPIRTITVLNQHTRIRRSLARLTTPALPIPARSRIQDPFRRSKPAHLKATSTPLRYTPSTKQHRPMLRHSSRSTRRTVRPLLLLSSSRNRQISSLPTPRALIPDTLLTRSSLPGHQPPGIMHTTRLRRTRSQRTRQTQEATQTTSIGNRMGFILSFFLKPHTAYFHTTGVSGECQGWGGLTHTASINVVEREIRIPRGRFVLFWSVDKRIRIQLLTRYTYFLQLFPPGIVGQEER